MSLFHELLMEKTYDPDDVTAISVLPTIDDLGALDVGIWVHEFVKWKKLDRSSNVCTTLIDIYAKCGEIDKVRRVFDEVQQKETCTWNALINGLAINGRGMEALKVFSNMRI
ncbi:Pentatricopeptide repeat-containing protein [Forsythia ovata]|uniref:Pentatricopeptide repeat-containing protein n=1 Tax=Forsythia ovata TaxID=205694 RepID=A0ABD1T9B9_9LAMI